MKINRGIIVLLLILMVVYYLTSLDITFSHNTDNEEMVPQIGTTIKTDLGRYQRHIDNEFIEIKVSGVPQVLATRTFVLPEHLKLSFESMNLGYDDIIEFHYIENEQGQYVILNIIPDSIIS